MKLFFFILLTLALVALTQEIENEVELAEAADNFDFLPEKLEMEVGEENLWEDQPELEEEVGEWEEFPEFEEEVGKEMWEELPEFEEEVGEMWEELPEFEEEVGEMWDDLPEFEEEVGEWEEFPEFEEEAIGKTDMWAEPEFEDEIGEENFENLPEFEEEVGGNYNTELKSTYCTKRIGRTSSVELAKDMCNRNPKCGGISSAGCTQTGTTFLCTQIVLAKASTKGSCVHVKNGAVVQHQVLIGSSTKMQKMVQLKKTDDCPSSFSDKKGRTFSIKPQRGSDQTVVIRKDKRTGWNWNLKIWCSTKKGVAVGANMWEDIPEWEDELGENFEDLPEFEEEIGDDETEIGKKNKNRVKRIINDETEIGKKNKNRVKRIIYEENAEEDAVGANMWEEIPELEDEVGEDQWDELLEYEAQIGGEDMWDDLPELEDEEDDEDEVGGDEMWEDIPEIEDESEVGEDMWDDLPELEDEEEVGEEMWDEPKESEDEVGEEESMWDLEEELGGENIWEEVPENEDEVGDEELPEFEDEIAAEDMAQFENQVGEDHMELNLEWLEQDDELETSLGQACETVTVGNSRRRTKLVRMRGNAVCPKFVDRANWVGKFRHNDRFRVTQRGKKLYVTRLDRGHGWGMRLRIKCCGDGTYYLGARRANSNICAQRIMNVRDCRIAARKMKVRYRGIWRDRSSRYPKGCMLYSRGNYKAVYMQLPRNKKGRGHSLALPICMKKGAKKSKKIVLGKKMSGTHCYRQRLRGRKNRAFSLTKATEMCNKNGKCGGVYDMGCDGKGVFYLCRKGFRARRSRRSCVYAKKGEKPGAPAPKGPQYYLARRRTNSNACQAQIQNVNDCKVAAKALKIRYVGQWRSSYRAKGCIVETRRYRRRVRIGRRGIRWVNRYRKRVYFNSPRNGVGRPTWNAQPVCLRKKNTGVVSALKDPKCGGKVALARTFSSNCVINKDKKIRCYGKISYGTNPFSSKPSKDSYDSISCGTRNCVGVKSKDGKLTLWGRRGWVNKKRLPKDGNYGKVSCGRYHCCALKKKTNVAKCFGYNRFKQVSSVNGKKLSDVCTGFMYTCGIDAKTKAVTCWGRDEVTRWRRRKFVSKVVSGRPKKGKYSALSCGRFMVCALSEKDGKPTCWGRKRYVRFTPKRTSMAKVNCFHDMCCGIKKNNKRLKCWGNPWSLRKVRRLPRRKFEDISCQVQNCCGITENYLSVKCFGNRKFMRGIAPDFRRGLQLCEGKKGSATCVSSKKTVMSVQKQVSRLRRTVRGLCSAKEALELDEALEAEEAKEIENAIEAEDAIGVSNVSSSRSSWTFMDYSARLGYFLFGVGFYFCLMKYNTKKSEEYSALLEI